MKKGLLIVIFFSAVLVIFFADIVFKKQIAIDEDYEKNIAINGNRVSNDAELKSKIGQMIMVGFRGTEVNENSEIIKQIKDFNIGGVILFDRDVPSKSFPRNIVNFEQVKKLISDLQNFSKTPLFVAVDAEGGKVNRLSPEYGFLDIPSHAELGPENAQETEKFSDELGQELKSLGFNLNFAPVVDLNVNPENPAIGKLGRSFSENPQTVIEHAIAFISGQSKNGIISAIKHFPGHGSSSTDSHLGLADVTETYKNRELSPFSSIISSKSADAVMAAHIVNRKIDPDFPATLSEKFVSGILKNQLGFDGVIISDDMQMGAIADNFGFEESIIKAVNAGINLLIFSNNISTYDGEIAGKAAGIIFSAVKDGKIPKEKIIDSSGKIKNLKEKYGLDKFEE